MPEKSDAISHELLPVPNWSAIGQMEDVPAAASLRAILAHLEGVEELTFAMRGWALRIIKERHLYALDVDLEVGCAFVSMNRWIEQMHPKHHRYYKESLAAAENLADVPFPDFAAMPRCNIKQLEKVSSSVRLLPDVVKAAKSLPEKAFVEKMNRDHDQHLEVKQPVTMAPGEVCTAFEQAVDRITAYYECKSRGEALEYIGKDILDMYPVESVESEETA